MPLGREWGNALNALYIHFPMLCHLKSCFNIHIPTTLFEALSNENWRQVMNVEMEALEKNKTWEVVDLL